MARRMFSPQIVDSDAFLDMSPSAQNLYFHLGMRADDDGFVRNPKKILRMIGGNDDDLKLLLAKRFILTFESGVIVIKHWRINNLVRKDWYRPTQYLEEKSQLFIKENGSYTDSEESGKRLVDVSLTKPTHRLGKVSIGKDRIERADTPSQIAKSFFEGGKYYENIREEMAVKVGQPILDEELKKFNLYWTEPNKSGTRVRWEQQDTFDVRRRLVNWFSKITQYAKKNKPIFI